jgi:hypothetical protein
MVAIGCLTLAACGRLDFETRGGDDASPDDATPSGLCGRSSVAADPLIISGRTFAYTNFTGGTTGVPAMIAATSRASGTDLRSTTADGNGGYELSIDTGSAPQPVSLRGTLIGYFSTSYWIDYPLVHAIDGQSMAQLTPGDVPLWSGGGLGSVYDAAMSVLDTNGHGTLIVTALTCDEQPVDGVELSVDPPLGTPTYVGSTGGFDPDATKTIGPYSQAVFLGELPGVVTLHAKHDTHTFVPLTVSVAQGDEVSVVILHASE